MLKKVIPFILLLAFVFVGFKYRSELKSFFTRDTRTINTVQKTILIRGELDYIKLGELLHQHNLVKDKNEVVSFMERKGLQDKKLSPGKYLILPQTQMSELIDGFMIGESGHGKAELKVNVLFNRCLDIYQMAGNISLCIETDSTEIINYITSEQFLQEQGISKEELAALFIPGTYQMYFDTDAKAFTDNMLKIRDVFWTEERKELLTSTELNSREIVTLASIVYSEQSQMSEEWPIIAGLYINRLRKGMKLQSDPTFKFCWGGELEGLEQLTYTHRAKNCPYNTYLYVGLPPGPICLVPAAVIDAVLRAEKHDYLFMMAKPGGTGHNFSETLRQHDRYVAEYRKWFREYQKSKQNN